VSLDLRDVLAADLLAALVKLVDERIEAELAARDDGGNPWLTLAEAAEYLHVSGRTVSRLIKARGIRVSHVGRRVLIHRAELDSAVKGGMP
jgi:excisionase family DNA binding protein